MKRDTFIYIITFVVALLANYGLASAQTELKGNYTSDLTLSAGSYKLTGNVTITGVIKTEGEVTLDLNGYVIEKTNWGRAFLVYGDLTIVDSNPTKTNTGPYGPKNVVGSVIEKGQNVTISGGVIMSYGADRGGIIFMAVGSTLRLNAGTLAGGVSWRGQDHDKELEVTNPQPYHSQTDGCGGAVFVNQGCTFIMDGGHIAYCRTQVLDDETTDVKQGKGGAVFVDAEGASKGTFIMKGDSKIYGCQAARGGGVYLWAASDVADGAGGEMSMEGGTIEGCSATIVGGGIMVASGAKCTISGGTIQGNQTTKKSNYYGGAGIFVNAKADAHYNKNVIGRCTITGGRMVGNKTNSRGCGVHSCGILNMSGGEISGNYSSDWKGGESSYDAEFATDVMGGGVHLRSGAEFSLSGGLISSNIVGKGGGVSLVENATFEMTGGTIGSNRTSSHGCGVYSEATFNMSNGEISYNWPVSWDGNYTQYQKSAHGGGAYLTSASSKFTMTGGRFEHNVSASGAGVMVWEGAKMTMTGGELTLNRAIGMGGLGNGGAIYVQTGTFELNGGTLSNNYSRRYGGAININQGAVLNLTKGTISGNTSSHGGGVSQEAGQCEMSISKDIVLTGNTSSNDGGALFIEMGKVTLDGCTITNNTATNGNGGSVALKAARVQGSIDMTIQNNAVIKDNTAGGNGGAISLLLDPTVQTDYPDSWNQNNKQSIKVNLLSCDLQNNHSYEGGALHIYAHPDYGTASMSVGSSSTEPIFAGNTAQTLGGAIAMDNGTMNIISGAFSENKANGTDGCGGAVYLGKGDMTITNAEFISNEASKRAGCVYVSGKLTVNGKIVIKENIAGSEAGAVLVDGGDLSFADCEISGNMAGYDRSGNVVNTSASGGALSISGGSVDIKKGDIIGNRSTLYGGGLYVFNNTGTDKTVNLLGNGTFENNSAVAGGGLYIAGNIIMNMHGNVNGNIASALGGGIYLDYVTKMVFSGNIAYNKAKNGGGLFLNNSAMEITGGIIRNNQAVADPLNPSAQIDHSTKPVSGYYADAIAMPNLVGLGGGIFLNTGAHLVFNIQNDLGVYENDATWGADDIFANGNNTSVKLPDVEDMNLTGYRVPTTKLYWAEDYIENDTQYQLGTALKPNYSEDMTNSRYDDAILDAQTVYILDFEDGESYKVVDKYLSLEVGYELIIVDLVKDGLKKGEGAVFLITPAKEEDGSGYKVAAGEQAYLTVMLVGVEDGQSVTRRVALPSGWWEFKETDWTWAYENAEPQLRDVSRETQEAAGGKLRYVFTNVRKDKYDIPETYESVKINRMKSTRTISSN